MLTNPFARALVLRPWPSRWAAGFVLAVHAAALLLVAGLSGRWPAAALLAAPLAFSLWVAWRRVRLTTGGAIKRLDWRIGGDWHWQRADGSQGGAQLLASSICLPGLVILHLRPARSRWRCLTVVLPADALDTNAFRHLRARLRVY